MPNFEQSDDSDSNSENRVVVEYVYLDDYRDVFAGAIVKQEGKFYFRPYTDANMRLGPYDTLEQIKAALKVLL